MLTNEEYASFSADGVIYLCPHCMGKTSDGRYDWSVLINRYYNITFIYKYIYIDFVFKEV